ncbi:hypothetical protein [Actinoplanes couchii]|nr:hypothetical protein [Actinoplanes couchii]
MFAAAGPATAHPLDVYLQSAYLTPGPGAITLDLALSPGCWSLRRAPPTR